MPAEERVLCFERQLLEQLGVFQGLSLEVERYLPILTKPASLVYRNRSEAELDPRFKQLIPYVILLNEGRVLRYRRGKGGEETRLHGLYSIGIGGHISDEDHGLFSNDSAGYYDGMRREVREEVALEPAADTAVAVINDDSTEVGRVHFGVVHLMPIPTDTIAGRRKGIVNPEFIPIAEAVSHAAEYESWSRFCLENFAVLLARGTSSGPSA